MMHEGKTSNHLLESFINSQLPKLILLPTPLAEQQRNKKKIKREKYTHRVFDDRQQLIKGFQKEKTYNGSLHNYITPSCFFGSYCKNILKVETKVPSVKKRCLEL